MLRRGESAAGAPQPPEPNKRRMTGEVVNFDGRTGKGQVLSLNGQVFSFQDTACLMANDRKLLSTGGGKSLHAEFSVTSLEDGTERVSEVVVREEVGGASMSSSAPSARGLNALQIEHEDNVMLEVDKLLLIRDDCDDPSLTRHPPMFQVYWELHDYAKSTKQPRTVPVVLFRTRLAMQTAIMSILSEKLSVGMDVVSIEECGLPVATAINPQMIVLSVCVGSGVFVFDLPRMHPPERDAVAMFLLSFGALRPNVPLVTLSINNLRKLSLGFPENFLACTPAAVGAVDVLQAAQQVLPQISQKAKSPEELINMVFGYKHAPRPTRSEDAALSIAFGRPAFHSRQVFSQLNNLARNQAFAQLLDKQGPTSADLQLQRGSVSTVASSGGAADDASPSNASSQPATVNAYKRRRLASWNSNGSAGGAAETAASIYYNNQQQQVTTTTTMEEEEKTSEEVQFFQWIQNQINMQDEQQQQQAT